MKYVIGDIHGNYKALIQCLNRSGFNKEKDILVQVGDVVDGWSESYKCVDELLSIKNLVAIKGNHDQWFLEWIIESIHPMSWKAGGNGTLKSYCETLDHNFQNTYAGYITDLLPEDLPIEHINFFKNQLLYYKDENNNFFVHGGFNRFYTIKDNNNYFPEEFYWNRNLWRQALSTSKNNKLKFVEEFNNIFIGHTTTMCWKKDIPINKDIIWNLDTGAGFKGKLTIMNIDTKEYFQSDEVSTLYPNEKGRNK